MPGQDAARVINKEEVLAIYRQALQEIDQVTTRPQVNQVTNKSTAEMEQLQQHDQPLLRLGLVGEIYTILEPACNYDIAEQLGRMNVEVYRSVYISDWVNDHLLGGLVKPSNRREILTSSRPYLNYFVGGHGRETVGNAVKLARQHYDGIIQIGPLTCMPEIVAQSVLGEVGERKVFR